MKQNLHPDWNHDCVVTCSCGNTFTTGSSNKTMQVDICSACHPFFTGEIKFVDRQGRVDKFLKKMKVAESKKTEISKKRSKKAQKAAVEDDQQSYKQLLQAQQLKMKTDSKAKKTDDDKTAVKPDAKASKTKAAPVKKVAETKTPAKKAASNKEEK
jgi:large subunit ribosomal protein L31